MNSTTVARWSWRYVSLFTLSLVMLAFSSGCSVYLGAGLWSDPRMKFKEFLELDEEARLAAAPTTQPIADQAAAKAFLDEQLGPYKIGPRDVITVQLTEVAGLVGGTGLTAARVRVDRNGLINLPIVGDVSVDGMELEDIEKLITDTYVPKVYREAVCHVSLVEYYSTNVVVKGAVGSPGIVPLRRNERNLLHALVLAGGLTDPELAWVSLQRLRRPGFLTRLNVATPEGIKQALLEDPLESGDVITVEPADPFQITVLGLVGNSGAQSYQPGRRVTFAQAMATARGIRQDVFIREATLARRLPDGRDIRVKLDLQRLLSGEDPDFPLQSNDIIYVNHTWDTWIQEWVNQHLSLRGSGVATVTYTATGSDQLNHRGEPASVSPGLDPFGFLQRGFAPLEASTPVATPTP